MVPKPSSKVAPTRKDGERWIQTFRQLSTHLYLLHFCQRNDRWSPFGSVDDVTTHKQQTQSICTHGDDVITISSKCDAICSVSVLITNIFRFASICSCDQCFTQFVRRTCAHGGSRTQVHQHRLIAHACT